MRAELFKRMQARGVTVPRATYDSASTLIGGLLAAEIVRYSFGENAQFERRLRGDSTTIAALRLLAGATTERELLERAKQRAGPGPAKP